MQAVNGQALRHYRASELESLSSDSLLRRARLLRAIGQDNVTIGNLDGALAALSEAHRITKEQLDRAPNEPDRQFQHAQTEAAIGHIHELQADWPRAESRYILASAATDRLIRTAPDNPVYMSAAAWSAVNLGNVQLNGTRDAAAAQASYGKAVKRFSAVAATRPNAQDILRDLANAYGWLADSHYMRNDWRASLAARLKQHEIAQGLHSADPRNMESAFRFAAAERAVGHSYRKLGDRSRAALHLQQAYGWSLALTAHDPENAEWLLFKAFSGCDLLFGGVALPNGLTESNLKHQVRATDGALKAQRNPRATEIERCVAALNRQ